MDVVGKRGNSRWERHRIGLKAALTVTCLGSPTVIQVLQPTTNNQQPTTNNQQPTTNNQQPTTNNQQPTTNKQHAAIV
jgi:hypothetical protein